MVEPARSSPSAAPRARRGRVWRASAWGVGAVLLVLGACEAAGWPFLVGPAERMLSRVLDREVVVQGDAHGKATVRFLGGVTAAAPVLQIAAPPWSEQPYFLRAERARMRLSYGALLDARRGEPLDIDLLHAERLVVHAERRADGSASWQFGERDAEREPDAGRRALPHVGELVLRRGELSYVDAVLPADVKASVQINDSSDGATGLHATAKGRYDGKPLRAVLHAADALPLLAGGDDAPLTPMRLQIDAGQAKLDFDGSVADVLRLHRLQGAVDVQGESLGAVGRLFGVTLPTTGAFALKGRIVKNAQVYHFVADDARVADSRLQAALTFDTMREVPVLAGRVSGERLVLADLAPTVGAKATKAAPGKVQAARDAAKAAEDRRRESQRPPVPTESQGVSAATGAAPRELPGVPAPRPAPASADEQAAATPDVLPQRDFDLPALRAMDANVLLDFARVDLGDAFARPLQPLKAHLRLDRGVLVIDDIDARTADGRVAGRIALDGTERVARWRADLRLAGVHLERWLKQERRENGKPWVAGVLSARARVTGQGRSTADMLATLDGSIGASMHDAHVSHLIVEAGGIDIAQALGLVLSGDDMLPVSCAAADIEAKNGVLTPQAMLIDTPDSLIAVSGEVSLRDETLDLRAVVSPKDFSPVTLRTPVHVSGAFADPQVELEKGPLARKLGASLLLGLINPLAAIIPLIDPGEDRAQSEGCASLLQRARDAMPAAGTRR